VDDSATIDIRVKAEVEHTILPEELDLLETMLPDLIHAMMALDAETESA
jgi:hypothetical protein